MRMTLGAVAMAAIAFLAFGQQQPAPVRKAAAKPAGAPSTKAPGLTVDGVLAMVEAALSDDLIVAKLRQQDMAFDLSTEDMIRLKKAKVSDIVLRVMLDPKAEIKPPASQATVPASVAPSSGTPAPLVTQTPVGVFGAARPSGATPAPGTESAGDPNDPQAPHDSGIYLYTKDREGKAQMVVLERASYQGSKTGGVLLSGLTYGIKKAQNRAVIPGAKATVRVADATATFYFYFDDKQAGLGKTAFGVGSLSNPSQFALLKLDVNKGNRETVVGQFGAFGASTGTDAKAMIPFKSERLRPGLYKVVVEGLKLGEYCFLASSGNLGAMAAGAAGAADIFDFGLSVE